MHSRKSQLSFEYLYVLGFLLVVLTPLIYYGFDSSADNIRRERLDESIASLENAINTVYALGPRNVQKVAIDLPGGIENITINGTEINIRAYLGGKVSEFYIMTPIAIRGSIENKPGFHNLRIEYNSTVEGIDIAE